MSPDLIMYPLLSMEWFLTGHVVASWHWVGVEMRNVIPDCISNKQLLLKLKKRPVTGLSK